MSDTFLETDDVLQALLAELENFRSASEKLTLAEHDVAELVNATNQLTAQFRKAVRLTEQQADTITDLQAYTEEKVGRVIHQQQESTKPIEAGFRAISGALANQEAIIHDAVSHLVGSRHAIGELSKRTHVHEQKLNHLSDALGSANAALVAQIDRLTLLEDYDSRVLVAAEDLRKTLSTTAAGVNANEQKLAVVADALLAAHTMLNAQASRLDSLDTRMSALGMTAEQVREMQKLTRINRRLLVFVLILTLASAGLGGYLVWLTLL